MGHSLRRYLIHFLDLKALLLVLGLLVFSTALSNAQTQTVLSQQQNQPYTHCLLVKTNVQPEQATKKLILALGESYDGYLSTTREYIILLPDNHPSTVQSFQNRALQALGVLESRVITFHEMKTLRQLAY